MERSNEGEESSSVIESAAADTTCTTSGHYQTTAHSPSSTSSPSSSSDDHHFDLVPPPTTARRRQANPEPTDSTLPAKRRRMTSDLDDTASFTFVHHIKDPSQPLSSPSSIRHPSGRMLPVGIAQPMQSREIEQREASQPSTSDLEGKTWSPWKQEEEEEEDDEEEEEEEDEEESEEGLEEKEEASCGEKPEQGLVSDADEALVNEVVSQMAHSSSDSESSSNDSGMESRQHKTEMIQTESKNKATTRTLTRPPPPLPLPPPPPTPPPSEAKSSQTKATVEPQQLPPNKKHHVFLSHSTGDQATVKTVIVIPLRDEQDMKVVACYHCMEKGRYNDKFIERAMSESCVVVIGLSPSYLESQRCQGEWRKACEMSEKTEGGCQVVVAALGRCSRPNQLRSFLYLDFIDKEKRKNVFQKFVDTIKSAIVSSHSETGVTEEEEMEQGGEEEEEGAVGVHHDNERDSSSPLLSLRDCEMGEDEQRRLNEEFEADFADGESFMPASLYPTRRRREERDQSDPRISSDLSAGEKEEKKEKKRKSERRSEEVEEGEVSDSSDDDDGDDAEKKMTTTSDSATERGTGQSDQVAKFYNELAQPDADKRDESPIFYMRNFNNWVKSVLIRSYVEPQHTVLDLCCGKGGDLLKWKEGGINYLVCADISDSSVQACDGRYSSQRMTGRGRRQPFDAEFHVADCCSVRLRDRYRSSGCSFNIVSCQFSVHYSFETYDRAHMMLRNACENLRPGGYFIGTTVDANEIVRRLIAANQRREDGSWYIGNKVFSVTLDPSLDPRETLPLFGAKYNFKLHGVVDLPEYLVHFPLFVEMLRDFDMELVLEQNFTHFFSERRHDHHNTTLMYKMQAFNRLSGTMPRDLWDVIGLYLVYVFRKKERFPNS